MSFVVPVDPPVRSDGLCAFERCARKRVIPKKSYAERIEHEADPFCSTSCCRRHHEVEVPSGEFGPRKKADE